MGKKKKNTKDQFRVLLLHLKFHYGENYSQLHWWTFLQQHTINEREAWLRG